MSDVAVALAPAAERPRRGWYAKAVQWTREHKWLAALIALL